MKYHFETKPNQVVLYMDMLGFRNAIMENDSKRTENDDITLVFPNLKKIICKMFDYQECKVKFLWMSDSFMLSTDIVNINELLECMFSIQKDMLISGLPVRGAICIGNLHHKENIWGEALVRAVEIEEQRSCYPQILISNEDFEQLPVSLNNKKYFKESSTIPDFKYIDPIANYVDKCIENAFKDENGIWGVLNTLISDFEDQCYKHREKKRVREKWEWLAKVLMTEMKKHEKTIRAALEIDSQCNAQPNSFEKCLERLETLIVTI